MTTTIDTDVAEVDSEVIPKNYLNIKPKFIDPKLLSAEALTDPDYRLKELQNFYQNIYSISCSKCHHCR